MKMKQSQCKRAVQVSLYPLSDLANVGMNQSFTFTLKRLPHKHAASTNTSSTAILTAAQLNVKDTAKKQIRSIITIC